MASASASQPPSIIPAPMTVLPSFLNLARSNLYQVSIEPQWGENKNEITFLKHLANSKLPYGSINYITDTDFRKTLSFLCAEATIPTSSYATSEVKDNFMGVAQEFAHTRINTDIDFTFYIDRDYKILQFFEAWIDYISGGSEISSNDTKYYGGNYYRRFHYPNSYKNKAGVFIKKFEKNWQSSNATNISYQLINSFPKSVSAISVAYGEAEILKATVTMNYDRYIMRREYAPIVQSTSGGNSAPKPPDLTKTPILDLYTPGPISDSLSLMDFYRQTAITKPINNIFPSK